MLSLIGAAVLAEMSRTPVLAGAGLLFVSMLAALLWTLFGGSTTPPVPDVDLDGRGDGFVPAPAAPLLDPSAEPVPEEKPVDEVAEADGPAEDGPSQALPGEEDGISTDVASEGDDDRRQLDDAPDADADNPGGDDTDDAPGGDDTDDAPGGDDTDVASEGDDGFGVPAAAAEDDDEGYPSPTDTACAPPAPVEEADDWDDLLDSDDSADDTLQGGTSGACVELAPEIASEPLDELQDLPTLPGFSTVIVPREGATRGLHLFDEAAARDAAAQLATSPTWRRATQALTAATRAELSPTHQHDESTDHADDPAEVPVADEAPLPGADQHKPDDEFAEAERGEDDPWAEMLNPTTPTDQPVMPEEHPQIDPAAEADDPDEHIEPAVDLDVEDDVDLDAAFGTLAPEPTGDQPTADDSTDTQPSGPAEVVDDDYLHQLDDALTAELPTTGPGTIPQPLDPAGEGPGQPVIELTVDAPTNTPATVDKRAERAAAKERKAAAKERKAAAKALKRNERKRRTRANNEIFASTDTTIHEDEALAGAVEVPEPAGPSAKDLARKEKRISRDARRAARDAEKMRRRAARLGLDDTEVPDLTLPTAGQPGEVTAPKRHVVDVGVDHRDFDLPEALPVR